jgi:predicted metal-dependent hydrolase
MNVETLRLTYGDALIVFRFERRDRKTLAISVGPDAKVEVIAPRDAPLEKVLERVRKRAPWIQRQQRFFTQFQPRTPERQYVAGETHLYLGRQYRLGVRQNSQNDVRPRVGLRGGLIEVCSDYPRNNNVTRELVDAWFLERAQVKFAERLEVCINRFPNSNAYRPISLIVRRMRKRWGSMTASWRLLLNCILVQAPVDAIDYVIHHELCHLTCNHHDTAFFKLLERTMPDWKNRKLKLERILA